MANRKGKLQGGGPMIESMNKQEILERLTTLEAEVNRFRRSQEIVSVLCKIAEAVNATVSLQELYRTIHQAITPVIDASNFFIALYDEKNDSLSFPYIVDSVDTCYPPALNVSNTASLTAWVIREKRPMLLRKEEITAFRQQCNLIVPSCTPSEAWLGAPLKTLRGVVGVITVQSYTDPWLYDEDHLHVLASVADMVAIAIERKRFDDELRKSEERFRSIITTVREGILQVDEYRNIAFANQYFAEMLGYLLDEVMGRPFDTFLFVEDWEDFHRRQSQREKNHPESFERRFRTKAGQELWAIVSASPLFDADNTFRGAFSTVTDISERRQAEIRLQETNEQLRRAMEQVKTLRGIIPICMHCKKIRDDKGYWNQVEVYVRNHTEAEFSHGLCPECLSRHYPEMGEE
jgi:PAS domain S-box-containing protein